MNDLRNNLWIWMVTSILMALPLGAHAEDTDGDGYHDFSAGTVISSSAVNENFRTSAQHIGLFESALSVTDSGAVGIGTTAPSSDLEVAKDGNPSLSVHQIGNSQATRSASIYLQADYAHNGLEVANNLLSLRAYSDNNHMANSYSAIGNTGYYPLRILTDDSTRIFIKATGNVGIGTMDPQELLHVSGNIIADDYRYNSDVRLKADITPLEDAAEGIACLKGVTYRWRDLEASRDRQIGLIAQEVDRCFPEVVSTDATGFKSVSYARLVVPLIENAKGQQRLTAALEQGLETQARENTQLKERIAGLEARLARLEALLALEPQSPR